MRTRSSVTASVTIGAVAVLTAGCLSEEGGGGGGGNSNTSNSIELMYGFGGSQGDVFAEVMTAFAEENDIDLELSEVTNFNQLIVTRVQGNQIPDIAMFPQPGIMRQFADQGRLADISEMVDMDDVEENFPGGLVQAGQGSDGTQYALPYGINVKSVVFYPAEAAADLGVDEPPATFDELLQLSESVAGTGTTPWCFGIEDGAATGWAATDWVENMMLINYGSDVYNEWVNHEIPFNDERVLDVLNQIEDLLLAEGQTYGGRQSIASTNFQTAGNPMFDTPPGCAMHRQGNFLANEGFFPEEVVADLDNTVGVFPMPGLTPEDKPVLGGGDLFAAFTSDNEAVAATIEYMTSAEFGNALAAEGLGYLSPRKDTDMEAYPNETTRTFATIAYESTEFVFDGSDQMPGEVGSGSFWREMVAWISGGQDAKTTLDNIENSWPA